MANKYNFKDLTGMRFGRWKVKSRAPNDSKGNTNWNCICDCGCEKVVSGHSLRGGRSKSCGCFSKDVKSKMLTKHGGASNHTTEENKKLYKVWGAMRSRCNNPDSQSYSLYGGRGIKVCDEWNSDYLTFYHWAIDNGYKIGLSIDRINVDGDYCPSNCRWVDHVIQGNNRRKNYIITYNGETHTMADWARITGVNYNTLSGRIRRYAWPIEDALSLKPWEAYHVNKEKEN